MKNSDMKPKENYSYEAAGGKKVFFQVEGYKENGDLGIRLTDSRGWPSGKEIILPKSTLDKYTFTLLKSDGGPLQAAKTKAKASGIKAKTIDKKIKEVKQGAPAKSSATVKKAVSKANPNANKKNSVSGQIRSMLEKKGCTKEEICKALKIDNKKATDLIWVIKQKALVTKTWKEKEGVFKLEGGKK